MKILLVCSGGMSTSLLVEAMKKEAKARNAECDILAIPLASLADKMQGASCVLVAPQIRHRLKSIQEMSEKAGKNAILIDSQAYGRIDGKTVLDQALAIIQTT